MVNPLDEFYANLPEQQRDCLLFIRNFILEFSEHFTEHYKWSAPFFYYKGNMLCYFWIDKKTKQPYLSFGEGRYMNHPELHSHGRVRFKLYYLDTEKDIDVAALTYFLEESVKSMKERGVLK